MGNYSIWGSGRTHLVYPALHLSSVLEDVLDISVTIRSSHPRFCLHIPLFIFIGKKDPNPPEYPRANEVTNRDDNPRNAISRGVFSLKHWTIEIFMSSQNKAIDCKLCGPAIFPREYPPRIMALTVIRLVCPAVTDVTHPRHSTKPVVWTIESQKPKSSPSLCFGSNTRTTMAPTKLGTKVEIATYERALVNRPAKSTAVHIATTTSYSVNAGFRIMQVRLTFNDAQYGR